MVAKNIGEMANKRKGEILRLLKENLEGLSVSDLVKKIFIDIKNSKNPEYKKKIQNVKYSVTVLLEETKIQKGIKVKTSGNNKQLYVLIKTENRGDIL